MSRWLLVLVVAFVIGCVVASIHANVVALNQCAAAGGRYDSVGTHDGYMLVGKILVPHTFVDYGCIR